ncbi:MAG: nitroreductase family protein [Acidimicrobiales bacterium]
MDALEAIATTRAIRRYTDAPVSEEDLARVLWAATRAPSGSNRQPFRFVVLRDGPRARVGRAVLGEAARRMWAFKRVDDAYEDLPPDSPKARMARTLEHYTDHFAEAPVIVLACLVRYRPPGHLEGASVYPACQNLLLAARSLGLGGALTQVQALAEPELRAALGIPDDVALHATITLGHPAGRHGPVRRRPLSELVCEDEWGRAPAWAVDPPGTRFTGAGPRTAS